MADCLVSRFGTQHRETDAKFLKEMNAVMQSSSGVRRFGSAALDLAFVAAGRYDGFWERGLSLWDIAVFCWSGSRRAGISLPRATRHWKQAMLWHVTGRCIQLAENIARCHSLAALPLSALFKKIDSVHSLAMIDWHTLASDAKCQKKGGMAMKSMTDPRTYVFDGHNSGDNGGIIGLLWPQLACLCWQYRAKQRHCGHRVNRRGLYFSPELRLVPEAKWLGQIQKTNTINPSAPRPVLLATVYAMLSDASADRHLSALSLRSVLDRRVAARMKGARFPAISLACLSF